MIELRLAVPADADALHALREANARWLQASGIRQWTPGEVTVEAVRRQIAAGEWFLRATASGEISAALRLLWTDPVFWGERPDDAAYVHGLMVDRRHAGRRLGAELLTWAEQQARRSGRPHLRLDCAADNRRLRDYYASHGFRFIEERRVGSWDCALFEKDVP